MSELYEFLQMFTGYRNVILFLMIFVGLIIVAIFVLNALRHLRQQIDADRQKKLRDDNLRNVDYDTIEKKQKATVLRNIIAADAIDPAPNKYLIISDGGEEVYLRTFTISAHPNTATFANTYAELMNFQNCESSIFVRPIASDVMLSKINKQINTLVGEDYTATKNTNINRSRALSSQISDANRFAEEIETGDTKFFDVGFLFTLYASTVKDLNKMTQEFHSKAKEKGIEISNCYAIQAEAFAENGPWNKTIKTQSSIVKQEAVKFFPFDKRSVSTLYNYTQTSFSHKGGIILGLDMFTAAPVVFDTFDGSHDGYVGIVAGKTGTGKSALIKMMVCREVLMGYHFVCIDSKQRKGTSEGEYASLANLCDGVNFQISNATDSVMNIFDIAETTRNVKDKDNIVHEIRSLDIADKITMLSNIIMKLVQGSSYRQEISLKDNTYITSIIRDNLKQLYRSFGFVDGDPDSLYTRPGAPNAQKDNSTLRNGKALKILPTMTDFYKQLLLSRRDNTDEQLSDSFNIIIMSLKDYVKELYYSERSVTFFEKEDFLTLPYKETIKAREFVNLALNGLSEKVEEVHGIRAYFDGQSTVHLDRDCPFTNIDISTLPDAEKELTRQIALDFVNENFIKRNSLSLDANAKMKVILDEAHELFKDEYDRATVDGVSRTARSRNVSLWLISQTLKEYDTYPETQAILKQAATKFVFKQDPTDRQYLIEKVGFTPAQAGIIVDNLGGNPDDESDSNKHRGEVCIMDNKSVCFCKVAYRKETEQLAVATDAQGIEEAFKRASGL